VKTFLAADARVKTGRPNLQKGRYGIPTHRTCNHIRGLMTFCVTYGQQLVRITSTRVELRRIRKQRHIQENWTE
jgi:hypothetical protein